MAKSNQAGEGGALQIRDRINRFDRVRCADLLANPLNWRSHSDGQKAAMSGILAEVGMVDALLVREIGDGTYEIVDGHMRAGMMPDQMVPVLVLDVTPEEATKILLTFDPISAMATANAVTLDALLREVEFSDAALQALVAELADSASLYIDEATAAEIIEDEVPEPPVDPITNPGDLWILGTHRVLCGDSTKAEDIERLMGGEKVRCLITDPPYGINWQGSNASTLEWSGIANDSGELSLRPILEAYEIVVSFGANCYPDQLPFRGRWICWDKRVNENADRMLGSPFELAWTNKTSGFDKFYRIMHGGVVNDDGHNARRVHPTQKPIRLMASIIEDYSEGGDILDLFCGSGTTLIAAEQLNRKCYGMEISPAYCDVIVNRWETLTGKTATLEGDQ